MRFDYQLPNMHGRKNGSKQIVLILLSAIGVSCIAVASFLSIGKQNKKSYLTLDKKESNPVLALESKILETQNINHTWKNVEVKSGDSLAKLFSSLGISAKTLHEIITTDPTASKELQNIKPGQTLNFLFDEQENLKEIKTQVSDIRTLRVRSADSGYAFLAEEKEITRKINYNTGTVKDTLYMAAHDAGLDEKVIMQMAEILGWDIDFTRDLREGDKFKVLYEEEYLDDKKIDTGNILAVEFVNKGNIYKAIRYQDHEGRSGYYTPEGYSMQKAFLRSPVAYTRISSHFSNDRRHPVLHKIRAHKGVDLAAPHGTPIKAAGDGKVAFVGNKGGYGKAIEISHGQKYSTFYAHLSRYANNLKRGSNIRKGQIIGYVGKTGLATGAHLHYEFRINGVHRNPITVPLPRSEPITEKNKPDFLMYANNMIGVLDSHDRRVRVAKND